MHWRLVCPKTFVTCKNMIYRMNLTIDCESETRKMRFDLQPRLANALIRIEPLEPTDFEALYAVAADPLIWEQHPNPDRHRRDVFETFFQGALESRGALRVHDAASGALIGSSRYYDLDAAAHTVAIGYTFIDRAHWGRGYNRALKTLMLDHAYRQVERVLFHVGERNLRSRKAMEKLGAALIGQAPIAYHGEPAKVNVIYAIDKAAWAASPARWP